MTRPANHRANRKVATPQTVNLGNGFEVTVYATGDAREPFEYIVVDVINNANVAAGVADSFDEAVAYARDAARRASGTTTAKRANRKIANKELALVVFSQIGEDLYEEVSDDLLAGDYDSVVDYMSQWDYGEYNDFENESDLIGYTYDAGRYVLNYSKLHVSLYAKAETVSHRANRKIANLTLTPSDITWVAREREPGFFSVSGTDSEGYHYAQGLVPASSAREAIEDMEESYQYELENGGSIFEGRRHKANRKRANLMSLDEALQQVANASLYEDLVVIPVDGGFVVEDGDGYLSDGWNWTEMGLDGPSHFETTRLMESYESFDSPHHIRYNMPESVEALENGQAVEFAYTEVMDLDVDFGDDELNETYEGDMVAGWLLVSQIQ